MQVSQQNQEFHHFSLETLAWQAASWPPAGQDGQTAAQCTTLPVYRKIWWLMKGSELEKERGERHIFYVSHIVKLKNSHFLLSTSSKSRNLRRGKSESVQQRFIWQMKKVTDTGCMNSITSSDDTVSTSGVTTAGRAPCVTSAWPSPAACTAAASNPGSVCATSTGEDYCATKVRHVFVSKIQPIIACVCAQHGRDLQRLPDKPWRTIKSELLAHDAPCHDAPIWIVLFRCGPALDTSAPIK